jgi:hypothetical protein
MSGPILLLLPRGAARTRPPSSILFSTERSRADTPLSFSLVQKSPRAPFHRFTPLRVSLAARSPLPLLHAPSRPSAHFPALDSAAPRRKLPRSRCCHPISSVSSATRPRLAKMAVPHRALSLSISSSQEPSRAAIGCREASLPPETHRAAAAPPPQWCRATSVRPITPLLARCMLHGPLLLVPATSSHLGHRRLRSAWTPRATVTAGQAG